jgi:membrane protein
VTLDQLRYPIGILLLTAVVLICHRVLPARPRSLLAVLPGVVLTVVVWVVLSAVFSVYLLNFNTFASTYASLSGVFTAMFFVYMAALVLILGGELNRVLEVRRLMRQERGDAEV